MTTTQMHRIRHYPDGTIVHEDDFAELDNGQAYDDYREEVVTGEQLDIIMGETA